MNFAQNVAEILILLLGMRSWWLGQVSLEDNSLHTDCHFENRVFSPVKRQMLWYFVL